MTSQRGNPSVAKRRMRIGGRLLILLAVPLLGLLAVTSFGVVSGIRQSRSASAVQVRTDLASNAYVLATELQNQRAFLINGDEISSSSFDKVTELTATIRSGLAEMDNDVQRRATTTLAQVKGSQGVGSLGLGGNAALAEYSAAIDRSLDLATDMIDTSGSIDSAAASTADNLARAQGASAEEHDRLVIAAGGGELNSESLQQLIGLAAAQRSYARLAATTAPEELALRIQRVVHGVNAADETRQLAFSSPEKVNISAWTDGVDSRTQDFKQLQGEAFESAEQVVNAYSNSARELLVLAAGAAVLTLLTTIILLRRAVQSIARPLEELASQAEDVARVRLPEVVKAQQDDPDSERELPKIRARGAAEVFEVAAAFNDVQDTALRLASEQAALRVNQSQALTNLGRRNQTLLARQLDYITGLETEETDPKFLEHLFKLDHLASRMRRNAESLLILAGSETPRRRRTPAQVSEVIRASMGEVEDFERVRIGHLHDSTLTGAVVIDLVHLMAELIENALGFSPPDTTVEIDGGPLGQGGYQFAIIDHGVGMSDVELMAANHRLAGLDEFDGMPTRYLGQYVVAKLAAKMSVMVRLQPTAGGRGVTAMVTLPVAAMLGAPDRSGSSRPRPGTKASREQGPAPFAPGSAVINEGPEPIAATPEAVLAPDLRDQHVEVAPTAYQSAPEDVSVEPEPAGIDAEEFGSDTGDIDPDRWDSIIESVLESVDGGAESFPPDFEASFDDVDVSTGAGHNEASSVEDTIADWWTTPPATAETASTGPIVEAFTALSRDDDSVASTSSEPDTVDSSSAESDPVVASQTAPPDFNPASGAPTQHWAAPVEQPVVAVPSEAPQPEVQLTSESGALRKRVPGASLANRQTGPADRSTKPADRSAEEVRSRLASFQAGRSRGLVAPAGEVDSPADGPSTARADIRTAEPGTDPDATDPSQDWRSTQ